MAKVFLEANDLFTFTNSADVFGASGSSVETVAVTEAANITVDANVERLDFNQNLSSYTFQLTGNQLAVNLGGQAVGTFALDSDNITIAFADGSASAALTGLGQGTLGGIALPTSDATISGTSLNAADPSSNASSVSNQAATFTLANENQQDEFVGVYMANDLLF
ncbi:MAG: hypothetical protein ACWA5U_08370 [bacterium]